MKESHKLICSTSLMIVVFYLAGISNVWTHTRAVKNKNIYPLQDLGFELLDNIHMENFIPMNDYLLYIIAGIATIWTIFFSNKKIIIFKRWTLMIAILFLIRLITVPSTILTRPYHNISDWHSCKTLDYDYGNLLLSPLKVMFDGKMTCFDFFFSGHTINIIIPTLIIQKYFPNNNKYLKYFIVSLMWVLSFACMFFIILLHSHYTIDVEAALLFTVLIWMVMDFQIEKQKGFFSYWEKRKIENIEKMRVIDIESQ